MTKALATEPPKLLVGIDAGSTTAKITILSSHGRVLFSDYRRHLGDLPKTLVDIIKKASLELGDVEISLAVTGSAGMGLAERMGFPFVQEVVATASYIRKYHPEVRTLIDIGGEDSKIILFDNEGRPDMRMNGNCAGGTGSFIDQMASLLNVEIGDMNDLAQRSKTVQTIASRCGVFAKTDVQNLLSRRISKEDISASIFHAVAVQAVSTLARGYDPEPKVMFCGGPLTFLPMLKKAFLDFLDFTEEDELIPESPLFIPAIGTALFSEAPHLDIKLSELDAIVKAASDINKRVEGRLDPLFSGESEFIDWNAARMVEIGENTDISTLHGKNCFLGIDSGSTTTKIVIIDEGGRLAFGYYEGNKGDPVGAVILGLEKLSEICEKGGIELNIVNSCVTGYGEDLIKAAFSVDMGIVETLGHFRAASEFIDDVSFILDIGGQDMKAIFIENGVITDIEINEACSSGCGSFIETFARSLGYDVEEFARRAAYSGAPSDLGTRCTVFMNSKVKQSFREGATIDDISAGLAFSVIKNCLYKVLKIKDTSVLGEKIVVQGGTFRNPAVHRALELILGREVVCSSAPELMGAYGAALKARDRWNEDSSFSSTFVGMDGLDRAKMCEDKHVRCKGCENRCTVTMLKFDPKHLFYTGNKCERFFSNRGADHRRGENLLGYKLELLFGLDNEPDGKPLVTVGIPRVLNMFENYPFWCTLLRESGIKVVLTTPSDQNILEMGARTVMSENICFPAKLTNGHIFALAKMGVDRIFYPMVVYEEQEYDDSLNQFNCPIVTSYPDVIRNAIMPDMKFGIPFDTPAVSFGSIKLLKAVCWKYLKGLGVGKKRFDKAFKGALAAKREFKEKLRKRSSEIVEKARKEDRMVVLLLGRPYHLDQFINQKVPEMIADLGIDVICEDSIPFKSGNGLDGVDVLTQWQYPNRIYAAARWAGIEKGVEVVQLNSFGCGPDALICDETKTILGRKGKTHTLIRIDEVSSPGSIKLRLRSMMESLYQRRSATSGGELPDIKNKPFSDADKGKTLLIPYFSPFHSGPLEKTLNTMGYNFHTLPPPDRKSVDVGQKYTNNEICYPATIVIGDLIKALQSGEYDLDDVAVGISQTGGQCRASSYVSLLKKALLSAGFSDIPTVTVHFSDERLNFQPGFQLSKKKLARLGLLGALLSDSIMQFHQATEVREKKKGSAKKVTERCLDRMSKMITGELKINYMTLLREAVDEFNAIETHEGKYPAVGFVGEIYVKYNPFANFRMCDWLKDKGIEVVIPPMVDFFTQGLVNLRENHKANVERNNLKYFASYPMQWYINYHQKRFEKIKKKFKYYRRSHTIDELAEKASKIVSLTNQFGEGWLIPAEIAAFYEDGIKNIICVQPFGCIANHVIGKGIERRMKEIYPDLNILYLDCDMGSSEVNVFNRLNFLIEYAKETVGMV
ncbi:MAG: acyl-CoA dehydratase activase-related protein [Candidatus Thermoplasmatota archaeon]|jgi:predicted CoA-substrate-specific enzyme activase|nr:acyl-CoA dehydratase activase-related protein [Candidatus Thermoplasmatota archaeon]